MTSQISDLDEYRSHCVVPSITRKAVHVVPVTLLEDIASGKKDFDELEDPDYIRTIISEWLRIRNAGQD